MPDERVRKLDGAMDDDDADRGKANPSASSDPDEGNGEDCAKGKRTGETIGIVLPARIMRGTIYCQQLLAYPSRPACQTYGVYPGLGTSSSFCCATGRSTSVWHPISVVDLAFVSFGLCFAAATADAGA